MVLSVDFNSQTYVIEANAGGTSQWLVCDAHHSFRLRPTQLIANTSAYQAQAYPSPQQYQAQAQQPIATAVGGMKINWQSFGIPGESQAVPVKHRYCDPKQYVGFTKTDYYCTRCNRKAESELEIATSTCDKA